MLFVYFLVGAYLVLGFIYAVYVQLKGSNSLVWFPLNVVLGPVIALYVAYLTFKKKPLPWRQS